MGVVFAGGASMERCVRDARREVVRNGARLTAMKAASVAGTACRRAGSMLCDSGSARSAGRRQCSGRCGRGGGE
jgi:hypothetical protein